MKFEKASLISSFLLILSILTLVKCQDTYYELVITRTGDSTVAYELRDIHSSLVDVNCRIADQDGNQLSCEGGQCLCGSGVLVGLTPDHQYTISVSFEDHEITLSSGTFRTSQVCTLEPVVGHYSISYTCNYGEAAIPSECSLCVKAVDELTSYNDICSSPEDYTTSSNEACSSGYEEGLLPGTRYIVLLVDNSGEIVASDLRETTIPVFEEVHKTLNTVTYSSNVGEESDECQFRRSDGETAYNCEGDSCSCRQGKIVGLPTGETTRLIVTYGDHEIPFEVQTASTCELNVQEKLDSIAFTCSYSEDATLPEECRACIVDTTDVSYGCMEENLSPEQCSSGTFTGLNHDRSFQIMIVDSEDALVSTIGAATHTLNIVIGQVSLSSVDYSLDSPPEYLGGQSCIFTNTVTGDQLSCGDEGCSCTSGTFINLQSATSYEVLGQYNDLSVSSGTFTTASTCQMEWSVSQFSFSYICNYGENSVVASSCKACVIENPSDDSDDTSCRSEIDDLYLQPEFCQAGGFSSRKSGTHYAVFLYDYNNNLVSNSALDTSSVEFFQVSQELYSVDYESDIPNDTERICTFIDSTTSTEYRCAGGVECQCSAGKLSGLPSGTAIDFLISYAENEYTNQLRTASPCELYVLQGVESATYHCEYPDSSLLPSTCAFCYAIGPDSEDNLNNCRESLSGYNADYCESSNVSPVSTNTEYTLRIFDGDGYVVSSKTFSRTVSTLNIDSISLSKASYHIDPFNDRFPDVTCSVVDLTRSEELTCSSGECLCQADTLTNLNPMSFYEVQLSYDGLLVAAGTFYTAGQAEFGSFSNGIESLFYSLSYEEEGYEPSYCYICVTDPKNYTYCLVNKKGIVKVEDAEIRVNSTFNPSEACRSYVISNLTDTKSYSTSVYDFDSNLVTTFNFSTVELNPKHKVQFSDEFVNYTISYRNETFEPVNCHVYAIAVNYTEELNCLEGHCSCVNDTIIDFPPQNISAALKVYDDFGELIVDLSKKNSALSAGAIVGIVIAVLVVVAVIIGVTVYFVKFK